MVVQRVADEQPVRRVTRKIHFFWAAPGLVDSALRRLDYAQLCRDIGSLEPEDRYMNARDGSTITSRLFHPNDTNRLMLAKISRTELPETERFGGEWGVLDLPPDMGIAGVIHLRFFDNNIVGVTYNNDGPRPTKLRDYVKDRFGDKYEEFVMKRIIDRDALARLNRIETVKSVEITLTTHNLNYLPPAEGNDYFDVLKQVPNIGDAGVITIGWKTDKRTELLNAAAMKRLIVHLLENRDDLDKRTHIRVNGFDADRHHEDFDLAHDNIVVPEGLLKIGRNREVDAVSAFRAIDEAYDAVSDRFPPQRFVD